MVTMPFSGRDYRISLQPSAGHSNAGFTLMEVIVALSVVAIALLAIYRMHTQTLFMDARGRFDSVAVMLARQKLAEMETVDPAEFTGDSGDFGSDHPGYTWKIETEDIESDLIRDDGPVLRKIVLTIGMNEDESLFQLTTYRHLYEK
ncbi:prepilin-type N-terminal cleavage/methylation domain-containing protein [uncultured Desulfosarcina sp.]|uniref:prepilin-type N-terminal cleavage/methylation domain-containing protein n=1 Tax=uncultured Desulfosarcina sp. TaxID=218289 RepID=UPI0029C7BD41|nr:prepilin-type N-terminal cleavage/methylation domain-containing protein [uncultured Desulfosarcina sp.]